MAAKRVNYLPPFAVFSIVAFMYVVYLVLHLLPQLRRLNWLQPSEKPLPKSLSNDPHMQPATAGEVVGFAVAFHAFFAMFIASFFQSMVTPPGEVPKGDPKWERGQFPISDEDDKEVERIVRDTNTDLTMVRREKKMEKAEEKGRGRDKRRVQAFSALTPNALWLCVPLSSV
jgi:hypothetical protein